MVRQRQQGENTQLPYCRSMGHRCDKSASFKQSERRRCKVTQHNAQQGRYHNVYSIKIFSKSSNLAYPARLRFRRSLLWNQRLFNDNSLVGILRLDVSWPTMPISVVCVYAPSSSEQRIGFFANHLLSIVLFWCRRFACNDHPPSTGHAQSAVARPTRRSPHPSGRGLRLRCC